MPDSKRQVFQLVLAFTVSVEIEQRLTAQSNSCDNNLVVDMFGRFVLNIQLVDNWLPDLCGEVDGLESGWVVGND